MKEKKVQRKPYPLGAHMEEEKVRFSFVSRREDCGILLFDRGSGKQIRKIPFLPEDKIGNVYCKYVTVSEPEKVSYLFYENEECVPDGHARIFCKEAAYGKEQVASDYKAGFVVEEFDWGEDSNPRIPYRDALVYCLHVRGFTKHPSSGVKGKGTFSGIVEKIPYLKEIGVTTIELQPAYEFTELATFEERKKMLPYGGNPNAAELSGLLGENRLNYWGYKKGYYYTPKLAYAATKQPVSEFKEMVKALHKNQMEVVMQFYFPKEVSDMEILEILRFWVLEYHVDGFHLMGDSFSADIVAADPVLADTKLWYYRFDTDKLYKKEEYPDYVNLAEYNDNWYYDVRKFLKGDENMLAAVLYHLRHIPEKKGRIHYLSNYYGFTLMDLVSYDYKHNEDNGEDNRDGNDYNCSWNCGEEGVTRRAKVKQLRMKQIKNAFALLLLSQSTPLIFMGDEFGNSQKGNNNPYCQDNGITWLDWNLVKKNAEILAFWKYLVEFRRNHPVLKPWQECRLMDYIACGYPDLSYHGESAWKPQLENHFRHAGVMLCGKYARIDRDMEDTSLYLALNMHWENHVLALPKPPKGTCWREVFTTAEAIGAVKATVSAKKNVDKSAEEIAEKADESGIGKLAGKTPEKSAERAGEGPQGLIVEIPGRSITVYCTEKLK